MKQSVKVGSKEVQVVAISPMSDRIPEPMRDGYRLVQEVMEGDSASRYKRKLGAIKFTRDQCDRLTDRIEKFLDNPDLPLESQETWFKQFQEALKNGTNAAKEYSDLENEQEEEIESATKESLALARWYLETSSDLTATEIDDELTFGIAIDIAHALLGHKASVEEGEEKNPTPSIPEKENGSD